MHVVVIEGVDSDASCCGVGNSDSVAGLLMATSESEPCASGGTPWPLQAGQLRVVYEQP